MDIHLKKLSEIKKLGVVKKNDDAKKVELSIKRMHEEKVRTHEFLKQGKQQPYTHLNFHNRARY
jgi:hypothetical protein